jgi:hypothetical protein
MSAKMELGERSGGAESLVIKFLFSFYLLN